MTDLLKRENNPPPSGCFVAIDPAKWGAAWAVVSPRDHLLVCGLWRWTARGALDEPAPWEPLGPTTLVGEFPMVYQRGKGDPDDILALAYTLGRLAQLTKTPVCLYHPKTWKGTTPKDVHHARMREQLPPAWLEVLERDTKNIPKSLHHNLWDAVGLAAWIVEKRGAP